MVIFDTGNSLRAGLRGNLSSLHRFDNEHDQGAISMARTRILMADDHPVVLQGIRSIFENMPEINIVGQAFNGHEAVRKAQYLKPDIVIMDICMPELNGIGASLQLRHSNPDIDIIIFSASLNEEYVIDLFRTGISGYILKEEPLSELIRAVQATAEHKTYFSTSVQNIVINYLRTMESGGVHSKNGLDALSLREQEIFQMLVEGNRMKEIAEKLNLSPKTVACHKYNLMAKLNIYTMADLTKFALKKGIIRI